MTPEEKRDWVTTIAAEVGLARVGVAAAGPVSRADYFDEWLAKGYAGEMSYLARYRELRQDPRQLLPGARSIIVVADLYNSGGGSSEWQVDRSLTVAAQKAGETPAPHQQAGEVLAPDAVADRGAPTGRIAKYAWGRDYHRVLRKKLHRLADRLREVINEPFQARACVDTAPILEREWAAAAGVGWIGKNTMVLNEQIGSFFFLGEIVTTLDIAPSSQAANHCGTCTRCLDACPTGALIAPHQMDARKCISYLTIEHPGDINSELQPLMGDWLYGCDVCQDVCPFNRKGSRDSEPAYGLNDRNPLPPTTPLRVLQSWTQADYELHLAGSAMKRASLPMLQRNAAIVAANAQKKSHEQ